MAKCKYKLALYLISILQTAICFASAEDELVTLYGDEEFVSIATGISQPLSKAPAVASVITAEQIVKMGATDLDEVLETVPGLHVSYRSLGYAPIYTFRGVYSSTNPQVLMLFNGLPITNLYLGDRNQAWGGMPVESISRIEVIRGPGSAVYGADAFAGVINVITKNSVEANGLTVGSRYGTFNTKDAWIIYGKSAEGLNIAASLELHDSEGHNNRIDADSQTFLDNISATNASLAPHPVSLERNNIDGRIEVKFGNYSLRAGTQIRHDGGVGAGIAQALDPEGPQERVQLGSTQKVLYVRAK